MKAIMVMFDSLNRHMLPPYGCEWVHAPNFKRLEGQSVTFDNSYCGSMPCIPARRELHTGRMNFLHRSWGPLEPFDDSMPQILRDGGVHTHLVSDHQHYWEDGGSTYHSRYSTWDVQRGQAGDYWIGQVAEEPPAPNAQGRNARTDRWHEQDRINRKFMPNEEDFPQAKTMTAGIEFIERNADDDSWFLQIETFDPHEPFFVPKRFMDMYEDIDYEKFGVDWPTYEPVNDETRAMIPHMRQLNAALVSMCDYYLGQVMDTMDRLDLWKDTMLIVNTDHGFLLGEHDWWAKVAMPYYNEIANTPLFIWDPRSGEKNTHRESLVQTIDLAPTLLEYFGFDSPEDMQGKPLKGVIEDDSPVRARLLFGQHGAHVNVTDGRYIYMRAPEEENTPLYNYTLMPSHMRNMFSLEELHNTQLAEPFSFTKGCRTMRVPARGMAVVKHSFKTLLFDLKKDPDQLHPLDDPEIERKMIKILCDLLKENDAPEEQYERLGLTEIMALQAG